MTVTNTWQSSEAWENDVTEFGDLDAEAGDDEESVKEISGGMAFTLAVIVVVGLAALLVVSTVYCVRSCCRFGPSRDGYEKTPDRDMMDADTDPLLMTPPP